MTAPAKPLVYLILGASGSGRREVIADLIEDGLRAEDRATVMLSDAESTDPANPRVPNGGRWTWQDGAIDGALPRDATHVFFLVDGRRNPVDQIEAFKPWLDAQGGELARVLCIVHVQLAEKNPALLAWYEACVHFSDIVLLHKREGVENKWLSEFLAHFKKQFYPCLFEVVKDGRVKNPALILEPQARRMSQVFDEEQDWVFRDASGDEIDEEEATEGDEDEVQATPAVDPYFERRLGGRRVKELPDITKFLPPDAK